MGDEQLLGDAGVLGWWAQTCTWLCLCCHCHCHPLLHGWPDQQPPNQSRTDRGLLLTSGLWFQTLVTVAANPEGARSVAARRGGGLVGRQLVGGAQRFQIWEAIQRESSPPPQCIHAAAQFHLCVLPSNLTLSGPS